MEDDVGVIDRSALKLSERLMRAASSEQRWRLSCTLET